MKTVSLIVVLLLAGACDRGVPSLESSLAAAPHVDADDPCAVLSPAQVERAVGSPVDDEREVGSHDLVTRICSYETTEPYASVGVVVDYPVTKREFEGRTKRDPINTQVLDDVGDMAFIHGCGSLDMLVGDSFVSLGVQHLTTCEETEVVLRSLAAEVLTELEREIRSSA